MPSYHLSVLEGLTLNFLLKLGRRVLIVRYKNKRRLPTNFHLKICLPITVNVPVAVVTIIVVRFIIAINDI